MRELIQRIYLTQPELAAEGSVLLRHYPAEILRAAREVRAEAFISGWMTGIRFWRELDKPFRPLERWRPVA